MRGTAAKNRVNIFLYIAINGIDNCHSGLELMQKHPALLGLAARGRREARRRGQARSWRKLHCGRTIILSRMSQRGFNTFRIKSLIQHTPYSNIGAKGSSILQRLMPNRISQSQVSVVFYYGNLEPVGPCCLCWLQHPCWLYDKSLSPHEDIEIP